MRTITLCLALLTVAIVLPGAVFANSPDSSGSAAPEIPLPPLPELTPIDEAAAKPEAVHGLEARLGELAATPVGGPLDELDDKLLTADLDPSIVPAIRQRLDQLRDQLNGKKARALLERARKVGRKAIRAHVRKNKLPKDREPAGEWLVFVLSLGDSDDATWTQAVELYGMLRMLEEVADTPAVRQMINCYSYFGELVRIDVQRAMERLKDRAVPALVEAKQHDARKVRRWARRQLDRLGRAIPGEAMSTTDPDVLADVLRAFGRVRDVDATRVVLSFANSDRLQLRQAAREALAAIGAPAWGHYKDVYKNQTGNKPPRSWDWERTVRELFRLHDRARLERVYAVWRQGQEASDNDAWQRATEAFDTVLAQQPLFEHRAEMARAFVGWANLLLEQGKDDQARIALGKALRLAPQSKDVAGVQSRLAMLEGKALIAAGTPDRHILQRAVDLDPGNDKAKELLASLDGKAELRMYYEGARRRGARVPELGRGFIAKGVQIAAVA